MATKQESRLLQNINQSMMHIIELAESVEEATVKRIEMLIELADYRNTTLPVLMDDLGIRPVDHA